MLETDELIFRGDFRLAIPLKGIQAVEVDGGLLHIISEAGTATFKLGAQAEKWAFKIRNPRSLADKLDVKAGMRVSLCGVNDAGFRELVAARTADISDGKAAKNSDLIFFAAGATKDLARLAALQDSLKPIGAI